MLRELTQKLRRIVKSSEAPIYAAPPGYPPRKIQVLIDGKTVGSRCVTMGFFILPPGKMSLADVHPEVEEVYYVTQGRGYIMMDKRRYELEPGTSIYIPPGVEHQSFNTGGEELKILWIFPHHLKSYIHEVQGWTRA